MSRAARRAFALSSLLALAAGACATRLQQPALPRAVGDGDTIPCSESAPFIYTLDETGWLALFDPSTLGFVDLGPIHCPTPTDGQPNTMALDGSGFAWANYTDGRLYRVDLATLDCRATDYVPGQLPHFFISGMDFLYDPASATRTLYVASGSVPAPATLGTIAMPSLSPSIVGPIDIGAVELAGTDDGELWAFTPDFQSVAGVATLARIDPASGETLEEHRFPSLHEDRSGGIGWTVRFWGGSFWIFLRDSVYTVDRASGRLDTALSSTGRIIVGAGVARCAPLE